ncbi:SAM-dependent methyltransferase [Streptomyces sp. NPDC057099]|uniref:SAM-dependent methyltransferase n=1 Tax=Streptomyces sp. NPDC057099 TaxID=3346019 RepID=UPI0036321F0E
MRPDHPAMIPSGPGVPDALPTSSLNGASSARIHNYLLGGRDNHAIDRDVAQQAVARMPFLPSAVRHERRYVLLMVQALAIAGVRQLVDFGCGLPHSPNPVDVITGVHPNARAVCIDQDAVVHAHTRALVKASAPAAVAHLRADISEPETVLASREILETINWREPVILLFGGVLHHVNDTPAHRLAALVNAYKQVAASGSALVLTHATADFAGKPARKTAKLMTGAGCSVYPRTKEQIMSVFEGWQLVPPGLAKPQTMTLEYPMHPQAASYVGMARKQGRHE